MANQTRYPGNVNISDLMDILKQEVFLSFNSHAIATVVEFDSALRTVTAQMAYTRLLYKAAPGKSNVYEEVKEPYPVLIDMPALVLGGGNAELQFPISAGDECVVLFNDRDIDGWFESGQVIPPPTARLHSFSDGIALVGLRNTQRLALRPFDGTKAVLRWFTDDEQEVGAELGVYQQLCRIANSTTTLNTLIGQLITVLKALSIDVAGVGPNQGTVSAASQTLLTTVANDFTGLLE